MAAKEWMVYLSGEIHTDWREQIQQGAKDAGLEISGATSLPQ